MKDTLLIDLDGTLTDSEPGILNCFRHAFTRLSLPCPDTSTLQSYIGPPLADTFAGVLETDNTERIEEGISTYRECFAERGMYENSVFPGIVPMLEQLTSGSSKNSPYRLYVATSKTEYFARKIVEYFGLDTFFTAVHGTPAQGGPEPKSQLLARILDKEGLSPEQCIMIGDRCYDIVAAKSHQMTSIGVLWGYGNKEELQSHGATYTVESPDTLPALISAIG